MKTRDGAVLANGEEIFSDRAAALKAFERSRSPGWTPHATPGLADALRSGWIWETHGRAIVGCAVEAIRTDAEVDCPLVVRRP